MTIINNSTILSFSTVSITWTRANYRYLPCIAEYALVLNCIAWHVRWHGCAVSRYASILPNRYETLCRNPSVYFTNPQAHTRHTACVTADKQSDLFNIRANGQYDKQAAPLSVVTVQFENLYQDYGCRDRILKPTIQKSVWPVISLLTCNF